MRKTVGTERLLLRPQTLDDAEPLHKFYSDAEVMRFIARPSSDLAGTRKGIQRRVDHLEQHGFSLWTVVLRATGDVIGHAGLILAEYKGPEVEVAYLFGRDHWNQGYATEATKASLDFGFSELALDRIIALADFGNIASQRVMQKAGMTRRGVGHYYDTDLEVYEATRSTWPPPDPEAWSRIEK